MKKRITLIGDVHGKYDQYVDIVNSHPFTVQLGDFGLSQQWTKLEYSGIDKNNHKVIAGNHDDYDLCINSSHYIGDFGVHTMNGIEFFFVRGGISIDRVYRVGSELSGSKKSWWSQEELNFKQMCDCLDLYSIKKPSVVLSHVPPQIVIKSLTSNKGRNILVNFKFHDGFCENTSLLGNVMLEKHKPKVWIFGHHHCHFNAIIDDVHYVCLPELKTVDLELRDGEYFLT